MMKTSTEPDTPNRPKLRLSKRKSKDNLAGYIFLLPWLLGFLVLTTWPIIQSFYLSFTHYSLLSPPEWAGIANFKEMFTQDPLFKQSLKVTFLFVIFSVPLRLFFSLMVAIYLNRNIRGMKFYRTAFYFPSLIGASVAVSVLWTNIFGADGFFTHVLTAIGIHSQGLLANPDTALGSLIALNTWQFGSTMVIFLAGLKQIPQDLYESAAVDGAGKTKQFYHITLPMLSPVMLFNLVLSVIGAFQMFTQAYIITQGGPVNATFMYALYLYQKAFTDFQMGYASAMAWILLVIIALLTGINFLVSKYWVFYESEGR